MTGRVFIALSAFGAERVRLLGQAAFLAVAAAAGADGAEIRRELFDGRPLPLGELRAFAAALGLGIRYSVPFALYGADGRLGAEELAGYADEAGRLGAEALKVSLGHAPAAPDFAELAGIVAALPCPLLIENDQTPEGGRLAPLAAFIEAAAASGLSLALTFDIGNWRYTGEDATAAIGRLAPHVAYVHCKTAAKRDGRLDVEPFGPASDLAPVIFGALTPGLPRAVEFPIAGDDLVAATRHHVTQLATL